METIELKTTTAKKLITKYGVTGNDLFEIRKMLEVLGYIEPVRFGSQTYWLKKDLPTDVIAVRSEYYKTNFLYTFPDCYAKLRQDFLALKDSVAKTADKKWLDRFGVDISEASFKLCLAYDLLPRNITLTTPCVFICVPPFDPILEPKIGRQKQLDNLFSLLDSIRYHVEKHQPGCTELLDLRLALNTMSQIKIPRRTDKCAV